MAQFRAARSRGNRSGDPVRPLKAIAELRVMTQDEPLGQDHASGDSSLDHFLACSELPPSKRGVEFVESPRGNSIGHLGGREERRGVGPLVRWFRWIGNLQEVLRLNGKREKECKC